MGDAVYLPEVLKNMRTRPLFVIRLDVRTALIVAATPGHLGWHRPSRERGRDLQHICNALSLTPIDRSGY